MNKAKLQHAGKVSEIASELKKLAKDSNHSRYVVDNRSFIAVDTLLAL